MNKGTILERYTWSSEGWQGHQPQTPDGPARPPSSHPTVASSHPTVASSHPTVASSHPIVASSIPTVEHSRKWCFGLLWFALAWFLQTGSHIKFMMEPEENLNF